MEKGQFIFRAELMEILREVDFNDRSLRSALYNWKLLGEKNCIW